MRTDTAAAVVVVLIGGAFGMVSLRQAQDVRQAQAQAAQQALQATLLERLTTSDFAGLVALAREHDYRWDQVPIVLTDDFLSTVDPKIFAEVPWLGGAVDPDYLFDAIERAYRVFVPSRSLFGAMSFALEEAFVRNPANSQIQDRARSLLEEVRSSFIAYHRERTPGFQIPPATSDSDDLNVWVRLPAGDFSMGSQVTGGRDPILSILLGISRIG